MLKLFGDLKTFFQFWSELKKVHKSIFELPIITIFT
jgi:hypothetical protein